MRWGERGDERASFHLAAGGGDARVGRALTQHTHAIKKAQRAYTGCSELYCQPKTWPGSPLARVRVAFVCVCVGGGGVVWWVERE